MNDEPQARKAVLQEFLERGTAQIILDPRREGVHVPADFFDTPLLRLNISHRFQSSDLKVDWWGVRQSLTFPQGRYTCRIPWEAIFAIVDPRRPDSIVLWPEAVPLEFKDWLEPLAMRRSRGQGGSEPSDPEDVLEPPAPLPHQANRTRAFTPRVILGEGCESTPDELSDSADESPEQDDPDPSPDDPGTQSKGRPSLRVVK